MPTELTHRRKPMPELSDRDYLTELARRLREQPRVHCPCFRPARLGMPYPVEGYCLGHGDGRLMIPSVAEFRDYCSSPTYTRCPIRLRHQQDKVSAA